MRPVYDPKQEETYHIAGDVGPTGTPGQVGRGMSATLNFAAGDRERELAFRYEDKIIYADLYVNMEDVAVHWICPRCAHSSWISGAKKAIHWDGEHLSVEPFECPWELDNAREEKTELGAHAGPLVLVSSNNLCRLKLAIDRGVVRRA